MKTLLIAAVVLAVTAVMAPAAVASPGRVPITATLVGESVSAHQQDLLKVRTRPHANNAEVRFMMVRPSGQRVVVAVVRAGPKGRARALVDDPNHHDVTTYVARVRRTVDTRRDLSNTVEVQ